MNKTQVLDDSYVKLYLQLIRNTAKRLSISPEALAKIVYDEVKAKKDKMYKDNVYLKLLGAGKDK